MTEVPANLSLEIGHGLGPPKELDLVDNSTSLVASDISPERLSHSTYKRKIVYDATCKFPFSDKSFNKVSCLLPFGELLKSLTEPTSDIFEEICRVLTPGGKIDLLIDVSPSGIHSMPSNGSCEIQIKHASYLVWQALKARSDLYSKTKSYQLSREQVLKMPSSDARVILTNRDFGNPSARFYRITAKRRNGTPQ